MTKDELLIRLKETEWDDFECKEALDKLPTDVWESVSAFSNTSGGWVVFGIKQRMIRWEALTGKAVKWESDLMSTTVTYYRPEIGSDVETTPKTIPNTIHGDTIRRTILKYIRATPDISQSRLADFCNLSRVGVSYHLKKLKVEGYIRWEGAPRNGRCIILK